ncbi:hypothetical protein [Lyngbya sp. CCY1209]|jgi:hypothetical protein|uniref:hypothetical protein n=1 Tax=Lyngbya sp. CCY1209 TaxID=2886103 RepID=UPI002D1FFBDB|nr:hypothetical protein [Lyngbya sp. CCY1209]MEB3885901.1 hypothetical protein [Lyngbya sp. CCY1209]
MKTTPILTSACRCCQHYTPEGRRGGICDQLHVPVKGSWKACPLAIPAFAPSWERVETLMQLKQATPTVREVMLGDSLPSLTPTHPEMIAPATPSSDRVAV